MAEVVKLVEPLKRYLRPANTVIDNFTFRLHYQVTCGIYLLFIIINSARKYFGDPILCHLMTKSGGSMGELVTIYCWGRGTYTVEEANTTLDYNRELGQTHPGVGTYHPDEHDKMYHDYYQWVGLWLSFQMISFYLIRLLWKTLEGGKMAFLTKGVNDLREKDNINDDRACIDEYEQDKIKEDERLKKLYNAYKYLFCNASRNNTYATKYVFCEILLFLHIIAQFYLTNIFLGDNFLELGFRVFDEEVPGVLSVFDKVFPKVTICDFDRHGPGGDIVNKDVMCILPLNIVNEKIFLIMWFWLAGLSFVTTINLIYRLVVIVTPGLRQTLIFKYTTLNSVNKKHIKEICSNGGYGDWFIMKLFMKNIHHDTFVKFLGVRAKEIKDEEAKMMCTATRNGAKANEQEENFDKSFEKSKLSLEQETTDDESYVTVIENLDKYLDEKYNESTAKEDHHKAMVHAEDKNKGRLAFLAELTKKQKQSPNASDEKTGTSLCTSEKDESEYNPRFNVKGGEWFQPDIHENFLHGSASFFDILRSDGIDTEEGANIVKSNGDLVEDIIGGGWFDPSLLPPAALEPTLDNINKDDENDKDNMEDGSNTDKVETNDKSATHASDIKIESSDETVAKHMHPRKRAHTVKENESVTDDFENEDESDNDNVDDEIMRATNDNENLNQGEN